jgi:hypothetical protein
MNLVGFGIGTKLGKVSQTKISFYLIGIELVSESTDIPPASASAAGILVGSGIRMAYEPAEQQKEETSAEAAAKGDGTSADELSELMARLKAL